jgi:hypothetical protein
MEIANQAYLLFCVNLILQSVRYSVFETTVAYGSWRWVQHNIDLLVSSP